MWNASVKLNCKYFQSERKKKDRIEKEREQEMKDKDDEIMNLKERIKRTEIELKVAQERFEDLKNQDTRSRGFSLNIYKCWAFFKRCCVIAFNISFCYSI